MVRWGWHTQHAADGVLQHAPATEAGVPSQAGVPGVALDGVTASMAFLHASNLLRSSGVRWNTSSEPGVSSCPTAAASDVLMNKQQQLFQPASRQAVYHSATMAAGTDNFMLQGQGTCSERSRLAERCMQGIHARIECEPGRVAACAAHGDLRPTTNEQVDALQNRQCKSITL